MSKRTVLLLGFLLAIGAVALGVVRVMDAVEAAATVITHNTAGGYIEACGDLPGMVGDDC